MDVEVGSAHAGHLDGEADFSRARLRRRNSPYVELPRSAVDDGPHLPNTASAMWAANAVTTCVGLVFKAYLSNADEPGPCQTAREDPKSHDASETTSSSGLHATAPPRGGFGGAGH